MPDFLRTLAMGGPVMVPLAACSLMSLAVIVERALFYRRISSNTHRLMQEVQASIERGDVPFALSLCEKAPGPVAATLASGLRAFRQGRDPQRAMEEHAMAELPYVNRRLVVLDTVVTLAPLLGLLGTVTGMIRAFHIVSRVGVSHPTGITAGVAEALIATATGLVVAIYSLVAYNYFLDYVKHIIGEIEVRSTQLVNLLSDGSEPAARTAAAEAERTPAIVAS
jgi:biopolymer transport protein ExbB